MNAQGHHWHVPHIHLRAPHVDWHELEHPIRAAFFAGLALLGLTAGWMLVNQLPAQPLRSLWELLPPPNEVDMTKELPREWRWERDDVEFDAMVRRGAGAGIDDVYAKPRPRYY